MKYIFLLVVAGASTLLAGTSPKSIVAVRCSQSPRIDGILDDDAWRSARGERSFTQFDPEEGAAPTESTVVRLVYDDNALYVGVLCYDSHPDEVAGQLTRRDRTVQADRFSVIVDSYHDFSTAFLFSGSVSGVQSDGVLSHDGRVYDVDWDAVWEFAAKRLPVGWSAEFRIPFSALRFGAQDSGYVWGINFRRYIPRKQETDEWVMLPRSATPAGTISSVSTMGNVTGIRDIHPPLHLELLPYEVSKQNFLSQPEPFPLRSEFKGSGGLDLKYGLSNNFTLDATFNPDFGQVEVDQRVLNLTVFETDFPEKRPFFLEGSQLFSFGTMFDNQQLQLFYSRRIGQTPGYGPDPGYAVVDAPQATTILGAAKVTGRTDGGLTVAGLSALTDHYDVTEQSPADGTRRTFTADPRASYNVLRLKQDLGGRSSVGVMATSLMKDASLPSLAGGLDWNLGFDEYAFDGYLAGSKSDPSISGGAGRIGFAKPQGEHVQAFTAYEFSSRNFAVNDLGFYSQPLEHGGYTAFRYKEDHAGEPLRRYGVTFETDYRWNWDEVSTKKSLEGIGTLEFRNFWTVTLDGTLNLRAYDDANRLSYYGTTPVVALYHRPTTFNLQGTVQTDISKPASLALTTGYQFSSKNMSQLLVIPALTLRPSNVVEFDPGLVYFVVRNEEAWAIGNYTPDNHAIFGDRDIDEYDFYLRSTVLLTPSVSIQFFGQLFLVKARYAALRSLTSPDGFTPNALPGTIESNLMSFDANLILRWEYLPGSTIYLVWTQARIGDDGIYDASLGNDVSGAFRLPMDNVILAKISYWWSL